ncbi:MAG: DNA cytosine methyltransferase [Streptococcus suis]
MLNSKDFQAPQNRERIFIIGHSRRYRPRIPISSQRRKQLSWS